jgi:hypothetical protein
MTDIEPVDVSKERWWVIFEGNLLAALRRVADGEDPDMAMAELLANSVNRHEPGLSWRDRAERAEAVLLEAEKERDQQREFKHRANERADRAEAALERVAAALEPEAVEAHLRSLSWLQLSRREHQEDIKTYVDGNLRSYATKLRVALASQGEATPEGQRFDVEPVARVKIRMSEGSMEVTRDPSADLRYIRAKLESVNSTTVSLSAREAGDLARLIPNIEAALRGEATPEGTIPNDHEPCAGCGHPFAAHRTPGTECVFVLGIHEAFDGNPEQEEFCSCGRFREGASATQAQEGEG